MRPLQTGLVVAGSIQADRRLYLTRDQTEVVEEGDPRAKVLLASRGHQIPPVEQKRLGLRMEDGRIVWGGDTPVEEIEARVEEKQAERAPNKMAKPKAKKAKG